MLNRFTDESNEIRLCELTVYGSDSGGTISETDLHNGYRSHVFSQDFGTNNNIQMYVQYSSSGSIVLEKMFGSLTGPTGDCEEPLTDDYILFEREVLPHRQSIRPQMILMFLIYRRVSMISSFSIQLG